MQNMGPALCTRSAFEHRPSVARDILVFVWVLCLDTSFGSKMDPPICMRFVGSVVRFFVSRTLSHGVQHVDRPHGHPLVQLCLACLCCARSSLSVANPLASFPKGSCLKCVEVCGWVRGEK